MSENRLQAAAERREHMLGLAFTVFACPHRLAVDGDVTRVPAFLEKQGSQNIGQSLRVDDAQGFGQRRMTRRRPAYKAEFRLLTPAQAPPKKKGRLHSAPSTQERYDDQAQDRPQHVVLPLLAARVRNLPQNRFQLQCRGLLESGSLLNQNTRARSISSVRSIDCPVGMSRLWLPPLAIRVTVRGLQSQTHAFWANHSCEVRHDAQKVLLKKTGMQLKVARSICMPVEMVFRVLGQAKA